MKHKAPKPELHLQTSPDGVCIVTLRGELSLKHQAVLHSMLREVSTPEKVIRIEISEPSAIDLCFLQLLRAFTKSAVQQGKTVHINAALAEADRTLMTRTGFHHFLSTNINP